MTISTQLVIPAMITIADTKTGATPANPQVSIQMGSCQRKNAQYAAKAPHTTMLMMITISRGDRTKEASTAGIQHSAATASRRQ